MWRVKSKSTAQRKIFHLAVQVENEMFLMIIPAKSIQLVPLYPQGFIPDQNCALWTRTTQVSDLGHSGPGKGECVTHNRILLIYLIKLFNHNILVLAICPHTIIPLPGSGMK